LLGGVMKVLWPPPHPPDQYLKGEFRTNAAAADTDHCRAATEECRRILAGHGRQAQGRAELLVTISVDVFAAQEVGPVVKDGVIRVKQVKQKVGS
jgi:hypothetical protein